MYSIFNINIKCRSINVRGLNKSQKWSTTYGTMILKYQEWKLFDMADIS